VTSQVLKKALKHLSKDPKMNSLINIYSIPTFNETSDYFNALSRSIIFQQLSGKAAETIYNRYLNLFKNRCPTPEEVIDFDVTILRSAGISQQKTEYLKGLARYFSKQENKIDFIQLTGTAVFNELIKLKGIGQWTIDMFLMFTLHRVDILPVTDLGIQKGFKILFGLDYLPSNEYMVNKSNPWRPYRTIASFYLWRVVDDIDFSKIL
jgi:3-methyladenine DNA glycosylase/8-oxoguanine DNA glycosylase